MITSFTPIDFEQNNKLIAEFDGLYYDNGDWRDSNGIIHSLFEIDNGIIPYHKDWNRLIPVIKKFRDLYSFNLMYNPNNLDIGIVYRTLVRHIKLRNKIKSDAKN